MIRLALILAMLVSGAVAAAARAGPLEADRRFRALSTLYFLPRVAFPLFATHGAHPGDVIRLGNGQRLIGFDSARGTNRCFPDLAVKGPYRTHGYRDSNALDAEAVLGSRGGVGSAGLIDLSGQAQLSVARMAEFRIDPLSLTETDPDTGVLGRVTDDPGCAPILEIGGGAPRGRVIVAAVFSGNSGLSVLFTLTGAGRLSVSKGALLQAIATVYPELSVGPDAIDLDASAGIGEIGVVGLEGNKALAVVPLYLNPEALAAVTYALQGRTGTELRDAVNEALGRSGPGALEAVLDFFRSHAGLELEADGWARRFFEGEARVTANQLAADYGDRVDMEAVAYWAAAQELAGVRSGLEPGQ